VRLVRFEDGPVGLAAESDPSQQHVVLRSLLVAAAVGVTALLACTATANAGSALADPSPPHLTITGGGARPIRFGLVYPPRPEPPQPTTTSTTLLHSHGFSLTITASDTDSYVRELDWSYSVAVGCKSASGLTSQTQSLVTLVPLINRPTSKQRVIVVQVIKTFSCQPGYSFTGADAELTVVATNGSGRKTTSPTIRVRVRS
jgi:hypothetical protein